MPQPELRVKEKYVPIHEMLHYIGAESRQSKGRETVLNEISQAKCAINEAQQACQKAWEMLDKWQEFVEIGGEV